MTAHDVLKTADQRGIQFNIVGHEIRFDAPEGAMDDELIRQMKKHKAHLLTLLDKKNIWCSTNCLKGARRHIDGMPVLWCNESDQAVIDLESCPLEHWVKNSEGRPVNGS